MDHISSQAKNEIYLNNINALNSFYGNLNFLRIHQVLLAGKKVAIRRLMR
jgi:hypothetical protein